MKHTPGPWRVSAHDAIYSDNPDWGHTIAENVETCNRSLIAAAPELLEACKSSLDWLQNCVTCGEPGHGNPALVNNLINSINKAEGGTE